MCVERAALQFSAGLFFTNISRFMGLVIGLRLAAGSCGAELFFGRQLERILVSR